MKPTFAASPLVEHAGTRPNGKAEYRNPKPIIFNDASGVMRIIPAGWRSDGLSMPSWLFLAIAIPFGLGGGALSLGMSPAIWIPSFIVGFFWSIWLVAKPSRLIYAAFVHDWACQQYFMFPNKRDADALFGQAMAALNIPFIWRWPMLAYVNVRSQRVQWQQPEMDPVTDDLGKVIGWKQKASIYG